MRSFWLFLLLLLFCISFIKLTEGNEDAKRLYDDLMVNYNRHRRPSTSPNKPLTIKLKLRLSQIIDVHEIDQIMTCSVWLKQTWIDRKLSWDPVNYGGVNVLYVPYEMIWVPDIVLYNNADSNYNITISTKATLHYTGEVTWEPPAIFKSMCQIDVRWFPFDEQQCHLKFGSWTFSENLLSVELNEPSLRYEEEIDEKGIIDNVTVAEDGIDLSDYYPSVEWDIMSRVAKRRAKNYPSCCPQSAYIDVTYYLQLRRKPLFYTVNLVFPCVGISFLTILVFYLPSDSGEKVTLCISILVALTIFFLLLTEIIPATSITLPLIGKYLLFTMVMVTLSVVVTVISLNLHFRTPTTHLMPNWVKKVFLKWLPKLLFMRRPIDDYEEKFDDKKKPKDGKIALSVHAHRVSNVGNNIRNATIDDTIQKMYYSPPVVKAFENICFIAELLKKKDRDDKIDEDWKYVAMVLDRLFLLIFSIACFVGTVIILLRAPTLYDTRQPIDLQYRPANLSANPISF
ncbi:Acetylcholine receptor subunit alpha-type unc-38 [Caenorhabditis elegans]|uniref:Acetylcholine receptor subunit alpha-type unc-38 n=1 Tax=Caenorhabditis elegans TaxID=6239 RepID=ACH5_CAEEL|nr:Acetylcholine receptor subunit alpha-type unc-38 [Caenorhabditis elegans]Q23022.1 RecName: Full=Acetylcholine receptor subunit alpha-type unc-38; AltName: Full=Uncoordinated protein 38; Flags: Precursor [Caenorhabditis elegans]CAA67196.1 alpha nicotinic acetylcholine receptor subunit [Caenorhabditis elegans]CAA67197.1 alpha nicotinic acetylcholine receptor subunit [Caenorhabditis elegans]CCD69819.1 Acetylcholine receptor subunit alpha-type unc-38 [Caenorhabditis elegans]|eukprot:NP_491472.1 Acetylcholine receptor subunit alpha-type unc-38 [Caenorhabditis elegans]